MASIKDGQRSDQRSWGDRGKQTCCRRSPGTQEPVRGLGAFSIAGFVGVLSWDRCLSDPAEILHPHSIGSSGEGGR